MLLPLVLTGTVMAQSAPDLNAQTLRPTTDGQFTLWADDATFYDKVRPSARLLFQYLNDPLVYRSSGSEDEVDIISDLVQGDLLLGLGADRLHLGVDLPVYLVTLGEGGEGAGLGDVSADLRLGLLDPEQEVLGLALQGRVMLPTATVENALGAPGAGYEVGAIGDFRFDDTVVLLNLGTRGQPEAVLENVTLNDQVYGRLAVAQSLMDQDRAGVAGELGAHANYSAPLDNLAAVPVEGLVTGWLRFGDFVLRAGGGAGLTEGIGAPDARVLVSLGYEPPNVADRDRDGILDDTDNCVDEPEDGDGFRDQDGCPDPETLVRVRFVDEDGAPVDGVRMAVNEGQGFREMDPVRGHELHPGTYELQATAEGFVPLTSELAVPEAEEHQVTKVLVRPTGIIEVRVVGPDGRAIDARWSLDGGDRGRVGATSPQVKVRAGEHTVAATANGYRPAEVTVDLQAETTEIVEIVLVPSRVVVTTERIELRESVFFEYNKATIKPESFPLLDEVATVLAAHPEIQRLRIEGHTDERGNDAYNQKLSDSRAASVRQYLEGKGIAPERLRSIGYGESKPLNPAHNEEAWAQNRRVEMWIEERKD
ncbi:OmpA family protein [Myxococcota bacterium]|nr:OmpA family protein [Myxococcota bacterium]